MRSAGHSAATIAKASLKDIRLRRAILGGVCEYATKCRIPISARKPHVIGAVSALGVVAGTGSPSMPPSIAKTGTCFDFRDACVLMVDQSPGFMDVMAQMLRAFGFSRFQRCSSPDGVNDQREFGAPDLILIDPFPDRQRGMEFIQAVRKREADSETAILVIVVTGKPSSDVVFTAKRCGADYVVAKPFSPKVLLDRILWSAGGEATLTGDATETAASATRPTLQ